MPTETIHQWSSPIQPREEYEHVYIHVGMHRTGSTYLQKRIFPRLDVDCLEKPNFNYLLHSPQFDPNMMRLALETELPVKRKTRLVISQETIGGRPELNTSDWPTLGIARLKSTFPMCNIILVLRNQWDYLESMYAYRVMSRGLELRSFTGYLEDKLKGSLIATLSYDKLVTAYRAAFGESRVLVMLYEHLSGDPESFLARLCAFIGVESPGFDTSTRPNLTTRSPWMLNTHRFFNLPGRLAKTVVLHSPGGGRTRANDIARAYGKVKERMFESIVKKGQGVSRTRLTVHPSVRAQIDRQIAPSNRRLAAILGEQLSDLGYCME